MMTGGTGYLHGWKHPYYNLDNPLHWAAHAVGSPAGPERSPALWGSTVLCYGCWSIHGLYMSTHDVLTMMIMAICELHWLLRTRSFFYTTQVWARIFWYLCALFTRRKHQVLWTIFWMWNILQWQYVFHILWSQKSRELLEWRLLHQVLSENAPQSSVYRNRVPRAPSKYRELSYLVHRKDGYHGFEA